MKTKRKSAVQSFGRFLMLIQKRLEAVHSTWKTWMGAEKKFSVLHKNISIRRKCQVWYRGWPDQWQTPALANGTVLQIRIWALQRNGAMWSVQIPRVCKGEEIHPLPRGDLWSWWKTFHRKGTECWAQTDAYGIFARWWQPVNRSRSGGPYIRRRCKRQQRNWDRHL